MLALAAVAMTAAAVGDSDRPFAQAAELCYTYLVNRGASTTPFTAAGYVAQGKNAKEQLFKHPNERLFILLRQTDRFPVPECVAMTPGWESETEALVPELEPVLGKAVEMGSMTMFDIHPTAIAAFLKNTTVQGGHFSTLEMNRVDKEKSE
jgi:hypothetical protein